MGMQEKYDQAKYAISDKGNQQEKNNDVDAVSYRFHAEIIFSSDFTTLSSPIAPCLCSLEPQILAGKTAELRILPQF